MNSPWRLVERETRRTVVAHLEVAARYWSRLVGWQLRPEPPAGYGLLLVPCPSVHTFMMRFTLDLVLLDRTGRVIEIRHAVRPWRVIIPKERTFAFLEVPSSQGGVKLEPGALLRLAAHAQRRPQLPRALHSWCEEA